VTEEPIPQIEELKPETNIEIHYFQEEMVLPKEEY